MDRKQEQALADPKVRRAFEEELLFGEATDTLAGLIESLGLSQKSLAERLGVSEGRVSQILSGRVNLTLRSLAAIGWALGIRFGLNPIPMRNRAGTPAVNDPPAPEWLGMLWRDPIKARFRQDVVIPKQPKSASPSVKVSFYEQGTDSDVEQAA